MVSCEHLQLPPLQVEGFYIGRKSRRDGAEGTVFLLRRDLHLHEPASNERLGTDTH